MAVGGVTPREAWITTIQPLARALSDESGGVAAIHTHLRQVLETEAWRCFIDPTGKEHTPSFEKFLTRKPFAGVGADSSDQVRDMLTDTRLRDKFDKAIKKPGGRPEKTVDNVHSKRPSGNSESAALRRLRKDAPELHAEVLADRLSAHAAMVRAGYRPKTVTVPITRPEAVAKSLLKYMSADDIAKLIAVLVGANHPPT